MSLKKTLLTMLGKNVALARKLYAKIPFSHATRIKHRNFVLKLSPSLMFMNGNVHQNCISPINIIEHTGTIDTLANSIDIQTSNNPEVSIIIPIYGQIDYTLKCLKSIEENQPCNSIEIIVVDDCSPDNSFELLKKVVGIKLFQNETNQGFIKTCNFGAKQASGEYVYFLNNDTQVISGWLDELVATFSNFPGTGLVGSKLIYPNGVLQEAGGIIWNDGRAWNYGRNQPADLPEFNYAREVDYCSGASIMLPKSVFKQFGGFDEKYLPAYCEDSDLALKVRDAGYRVIYQPLSTVIHFEGITSGTDETQGVKSYQVNNSKKLFETWQHRLSSYQEAGKDIDKAKDRRADKRVLVIDHCTPTPDKDAGSVTVFNLLLLLREQGFQVTFIPESNFLYMPKYTTLLQKVGVEVVYSPYVTSVKQHVKQYGERYDLVFLFRPQVHSAHITDIKEYCLNAKILYHTVDLHFLRMSREAELLGRKDLLKNAEAIKGLEIEAIKSSDGAIVHSTSEKDILVPQVSTPLFTFPLIFNVQDSNVPFERRNNLAFIGGYQHPPNIDAVEFFVAEVMPILRKKIEGIKFYIVGSNPPENVLKLACDDVIVTGYIFSLANFLSQIKISVAPLRFGAGIKGKIGSAMSLGLPVIGTSIALEGMSLSDEVIIADSAKKMADSIVSLYFDKDKWNVLSQKSLEFTRINWSDNASYDTLKSILTKLNLPIKEASYDLTLYEDEMLRKVGFNLDNKRLKPLVTLSDFSEYTKFANKNNTYLNSLINYELSLTENSQLQSFDVPGECLACKKISLFHVDALSGGFFNNNQLIPNWRERLVCKSCLMNNRQRLIAALVKQEISDNNKIKNIYLMEQVTPIYHWAKLNLRSMNLSGSEYLGFEYEAGEVVNGIRHEDIQNLSFPDSSLDIIVSNDVFEHVPEPEVAFKECVRVLKKGGVMLATIPFYIEQQENIQRAKLLKNCIEHILPEQYHGNPVSEKGSLVFNDFGWDIITDLMGCGFSNVSIELYASKKYAHLGGAQLIFRAIK